MSIAPTFRGIKGSIVTFLHINFFDIVFVVIFFWLGWAAKGKWSSSKFFKRKDNA